MDLVKILKNVPNGTELYSTIHGTVKLRCVSLVDITYPILVDIDGDKTQGFTKDGRISSIYNGECTLFPSKENRDWSIFKQQLEYNFKPFDKVLVRDCDNDVWEPNLFRSLANDEFKYIMLDGIGYKQCIPYEGNEELALTTKNL